MKQEKEKPVKYYELFCSICNHEWLSKNEDNICPECKGTILEFAKLR